MEAMMHVSATIETMNASSACGPAIQADEAVMKAGTSAIRTIHSTRVNVRRTSAFAITGPYPPRVPSASDTAMPIGDHSRYSSSTTRRRPCGPDVASSMTSRRQPPARALSVAAMSQYPRSPARSRLAAGSGDHRNLHLDHRLDALEDVLEAGAGDRDAVVLEPDHGVRRVVLVADDVRHGNRQLGRATGVVELGCGDARDPRVHVHDRVHLGVLLVDHPVLDGVHRHPVRLDAGWHRQHHGAGVGL